MIKAGTRVRIRYGTYKDWVGVIVIRRDKTGPLFTKYMVEFPNGKTEQFPEHALEVLDPEQ